MPCPICPNCAGGWPKAPPPSVSIRKEGDPVFKSDKRLYLTEDRSRAVEEGDPAAAFLLVSEGGELQDEEAARLGLTGKKMAEPEPNVVYSTVAPPKPDDAPADEPKTDEPQPADEPVQAKAVAAPPENKARAASARKVDEDK